MPCHIKAEGDSTYLILPCPIYSSFFHSRSFYCYAPGQAGDRNTKLNKTFFCFQKDCTLVGEIDKQINNCSSTLGKYFSSGTNVILNVPWETSKAEGVGTREPLG